MTQPLKAVVFDWAGTMIDFGSRAPVVALCRAFAAEGVTIEEAEARADMGMAKRDHIRALLAAGRADEAEAAAEVLPQDLANDPAIHRADAAIALARSAPPAADYADLAAEVAANPDDHEKRFALANAQMAAGDRDGAADNLLHIVAADRAWNEDAARQQLLKLFEVVGLTDPWVSQQRRRLSAILFG